jgi:hypothetical protein
LCQRLVPAACEAILKTGTAVINSKAFHLSMWLQHCLSWHLTPANFMVAVGSCMIAKLQQLDIQVKHHTVTAEWTSEAQQNEYERVLAFCALLDLDCVGTRSSCPCVWMAFGKRVRATRSASVLKPSVSTPSRWPK